MSRIVVVGGSGRSGALIVKALQKNGDTVVATIRNPKHMVALVKQGVEVAMLDLDTSPLADFEQTFKGADAVVFAAGSAEGESSAIDSKGVRRTVLSARKAGVSRYVAVSSLGGTTALPKGYDWPGMKEYFKAKRAANKAVRESDLSWTIVEPGTLTDGKATGKVALSEGKDIADNRIARADVASVVVAALAEPGSAGHTFQIVGGRTPVSEAVRKVLSGAAKAPAVEKSEPKAKPAAKARQPAAKPKAPAAKAKKPAAKAKQAPAKKTRRS